MLSALGSKLSRNASSQRESTETFYVGLGDDDDTSSSVNRGREIHSTGRGGLGNFRETSSSTSRDARPNSGPDDFEVTRGRQPFRRVEQVYSTGRGGTGNIRPPARESPSNPAQPSDQKVVRQNIIADESVPASFLTATGRGGLGNLSRSLSGDQKNSSRSSFLSSGRGGVGNTLQGSPIAKEINDEDRQKRGHSHSGIQSTGRGGAANFTAADEPDVENHKRQT